MAITRRQKEVLDFLSSFTARHGYSPSYEEIASGLGLTSLATVHKHVTNLQNKGLLQRAHNRSRSSTSCPPALPGKVSSGSPCSAASPPASPLRPSRPPSPSPSATSSATARSSP